VNQDASTETPTRAKSKAPIYRWTALIVLLLATIGGVLLYWRHAAIYPSTDNAYTGANVVRVAPQVSGPVVHVYVRDDDKVATGDPLFDIDPTLYDASLRNARAQFDAAASAAGTAADPLKAAATKLEEKRVALEDALTKYRNAKDAQKEGEPPSAALTDALKGWQDALKAFDDAQAEFDTEPGERAEEQQGAALDEPAYREGGRPEEAGAVSGERPETVRGDRWDRQTTEGGVTVHRRTR